MSRTCLTLESVAATLALIGISATPAPDFDAVRVCPMHAPEAAAEYVPAGDLADVLETGRDMAASVATRAASYRAMMGAACPRAIATRAALAAMFQ